MYVDRKLTKIQFQKGLSENRCEASPCLIFLSKFDQTNLLIIIAIPADCVYVGNCQTTLLNSFSR